jgi:hypothetical protein
MQKWLNSQNKGKLEIVYNSFLSLKLFWNLLIYTKQALESPLITFSSNSHSQNIGKVFPAFWQLKFRSTSLNGQVGKMKT